MDGFLNLLKPPGMSSGSAVGFVKRLLPRGTAVGHGGTLDPDAAGVLPICVGKATRLFDYIVDKRKEYIAELCLGVVTDTQDATGRVLSRQAVPPLTEADVAAQLPRFTGEIDQTPPAYSAIKRDGQRMYDLARRGEKVELPARRVLVAGIDLLGFTAPDRVMLRVACGKGVYIRTLCHDLGAALGCGGHMSFLLRSRAGIFDVAQAITLEELDAAAREERLPSLLTAMDAPLAHLPAVTARPEREKWLKNGNPLRPGWYEGEVPAPGQVCRVYCAGQFAGIGEGREDTSVRLRALLMEVR